MKSEFKSKSGAASRSKKILVVDDSPFAHNIYRAMFASRNITILSATSGSEAIEIISKESGIVLTILDLNMPSTNGLELLEKFPPAFKKKTPIVVVSSEKDKMKQQMALKSGAVQFFEKSRITELKKFSKLLLENPSHNPF